MINGIDFLLLISLLAPPVFFIMWASSHFEWNLANWIIILWDVIQSSSLDGYQHLKEFLGKGIIVPYTLSIITRCSGVISFIYQLFYRKSLKFIG